MIGFGLYDHYNALKLVVNSNCKNSTMPACPPSTHALYASVCLALSLISYVMVAEDTSSALGSPSATGPTSDFHNYKTFLGR